MKALKDFLDGFGDALWDVWERFGIDDWHDAGHWFGKATLFCVFVLAVLVMIKEITK